MKKGSKYRIKRKRTVHALVGFDHLPADEREAMFYSHSLATRRFGGKTYPITSKESVTLNRMKSVERWDLFADLLVQRWEIKNSWASLAAGNLQALTIVKTNHRNYAYARETTTLGLSDDLKAPTPQPYGRDRYAGLTKRSGQSKEEKEHEARKRTPDIEVLRPDLFREIEVAVSGLQAAFSENRDLIRRAISLASEERFAEKIKREQDRRDSVVPDIVGAERALRSLRPSRAYEVEVWESDVALDRATRKFRAERNL